MSKGKSTAASSAAPGTADATAADEKKPSPSRAKKKAFLKEDQIIKSAEDWKGYNPAKHKPLKKAQFEHIYLFFEFQAVQLETKAAGFRAQATRMKKLGDLADQETAKKVLQLQASLEKLTATLDDDAKALLAELTTAKTSKKS